jgi:phage terminase small subunit
MVLFLFSKTNKRGGDVARVRSPNRDKAYEIYKEYNGNIANREIANILDISEKTISGWKAKDKWSEKLNGVLQKETRSTPKENPIKSNEKYINKESIEHEVKVALENTELTDKQRILMILRLIKIHMDLII